jgi:hypothetical protein
MTEFTTPWLSNCGFGWFQNTSLAPTINLAPEWPPVNPKITFGVVDKPNLLCISPTEISANDAKRIDVSLHVELVVWWVSERIDYKLQSTIILTRMDTIQSKRTFGDMGERYLLYMSPIELAVTERKRLDDPLAIQFRFSWISKVIHKLKTTNAMEPTNVLTFQALKPM